MTIVSALSVMKGTSSSSSEAGLVKQLKVNLIIRLMGKITNAATVLLEENVS